MSWLTLVSFKIAPRDIVLNAMEMLLLKVPPGKVFSAFGEYSHEIVKMA